MASGTPFIAHLPPSPAITEGWTPLLPPSAQTNPIIPRTFMDAMRVRDQVYVQEQSVPIENEFDADDARCCHWVIYASVRKVVEHEVRSEANSAIIVRPRRSESYSLPIGTIRLVPFPHASPHPVRGGIYVADKLVGMLPPDPLDHQQQQPPSSDRPSPSAGQRQRSSSLLTHPFSVDRATALHDGVEPYVKLGRLAVLKEFRGAGIASQLVHEAIDWMRKHPTFFNPSVAALGFEQLGMEDSHGLGRDVPPKWRGLICCHAQESAVKVWAKHGFQVDESMGKWTEEGIPHVGMFLRVSLTPDTHVPQV
ncbi:acyl-CoA N-acyltransferase [Podospora appendiculata]|uniref:Acyl-CoA N-acyltransferase n=1 Tax=Podospora appendiculata TaxID=314037 RepID=A0AAE1C8T0_9PEZI|nr:acyl-CoA N-acyltransferase [Podospora appendiculata]